MFVSLRSRNFVLTFCIFLSSFLFQFSAPLFSEDKNLDPVTISVVAANPSAEKTQKLPIKIDLPQEVKPDDIIEKGELQVQYDDKSSTYFLFNKEIILKPKETRVFNVLVRNVWVIPQGQLDEFKQTAAMLLKRLQNSEYFETGKKLVEGINQKLSAIALKQNDETISQKQRIGAYRHHLQMIEQVKEDLTKMEKLLTFQGGPPIPEMLKESKVKSDAPSTKTTWFIIFGILIGLGAMGAQFYFIWHRRAAAEKRGLESQKQKLPGSAIEK